MSYKKGTTTKQRNNFSGKGEATLDPTISIAIDILLSESTTSSASASARSVRISATESTVLGTSVGTGDHEERKLRFNSSWLYCYIL
ncbi:hypothetical protein B4U80_00278 [Leptotrombidium deliense]|uniref:Uncharacterized protein n=1 Tax=Leptotrombidium deliense TaxID=299467 RepID=A0A443SKB7_9ACAR|nr:hypothetical protein B4U80_00278 [Leptotrombidium deliense]